MNAQPTEKVPLWDSKSSRFCLYRIYEGVFAYDYPLWRLKMSILSTFSKVSTQIAQRLHQAHQRVGQFGIFYYRPIFMYIPSRFHTFEIKKS